MTPVLIPGTFICDSFFLAELWEKLYLVQRGRDLHIFRLSNRNLPRVNKPTYKPRHQPWLCHPRNLFIRFLCIIWIFFFVLPHPVLLPHSITFKVTLLLRFQGLIAQTREGVSNTACLLPWELYIMRWFQLNWFCWQVPVPHLTVLKLLLLCSLITS